MLRYSKDGIQSQFDGHQLRITPRASPFPPPNPECIRKQQPRTYHQIQSQWDLLEGLIA